MRGVLVALKGRSRIAMMKVKGQSIGVREDRSRGSREDQLRWRSIERMFEGGRVRIEVEEIRGGGKGRREGGRR
jgi:hypothetical protein